MRLETCAELLKHGLEGARRKRIEQRPDLMVTGNLRDTHQRLGVMASCGVWQSALGR